MKKDLLIEGATLILKEIYGDDSTLAFLADEQESKFVESQYDHALEVLVDLVRSFRGETRDEKFFTEKLLPYSIIGMGTILGVILALHFNKIKEKYLPSITPN